MNLVNISNASPAFTFFNKVDCGRVYVGNDGQRIGWNTKTQGFANMDNLFLRKFVSWLVFSTQINKTRTPCVFAIFRQTNPLKIFWSIVGLNSIDVVDSKARFVSMNKTHCNQTVNKNFWSFSVLQCRHYQIPIVVQKWGKFDRWKIAGKSLFNAISDACCRTSSSLIPYTSVLINKPRSAFFNNFYWVHSVNSIAGHLYKCKLV